MTTANCDNVPFYSLTVLYFFLLFDFCLSRLFGTCIFIFLLYFFAVAQLVKQLATGWTVRGSNLGGGEIFRTRPDRPWGPPSLLYNGYRVYFQGVKRPGSAVDHPPPSSAEVKEKIELCFSLWIFMYCCKVNSTFFFNVLSSSYFLPLSFTFLEPVFFRTFIVRITVF